MRIRAGNRLLVVGTIAASAAVFALPACSSGSGRAAEAPTSSSRRVTTTIAAPVTTTTAAPTTTTRPPVTAPPGLARGSSGPPVAAIQHRLLDLHYDVSAPDGHFGVSTYFAVLAFQKVHGLPRTGRATQDVIDRLNAAGDPAPLVPGGGSTRVEVDLPRQVLFLYKGGGLYRIEPISSGSGKRYCVDGECAKAVTPGGSFRVTRRISGWRESRLGKLFNPLYFNGGIAIHGAPSVPAYPASHGCVRIPMYASQWFPSAVPNGTPVYVVGGPHAPVPFNEPAPGDTTPSTSNPGSSSTSQPPASTTPSTTPPTTAPPPTTASSTTTTTRPGPL